MTQLNLATSLNVGEVIFSAFQVYKSRFWTFIGTALQANIWFFVPNLFWLPLLALTQPAIIFLLFVFLSPLLANNSSFSYIILGIMAIFMIFLGFFCSAKGLRLQSVISRLAYGELIGQTETKQIAIREVKGFWRFWIAQFYISLELLGFSIFISRIASLFGSDLSFVIIELIISFLVQMWIIAKYFISDVAIALQNITAGESLKYSRELSKKHIFDISLILFITTLITLPAYLIPCMPLLTQLILLWQNQH
ncbi:MAG: hypothetical protein HC903_20770 [Methylacidiphilales bacterium]|nr:hypothetical protein [Candidatus Methylacidiphilales bacterium]